MENMEQKDLYDIVEEQNKKLDTIAKETHKMYVAFMVTMIATLVTFIVPLIGLIFVIPWMLNIMGEAYEGLL